MMILSRLRRHLNDQNWFAVALEMVIVITSVFLAFQVNTWNESRKNRLTEAIYLQELREDFQANRVLEDIVQSRMMTMLPEMDGLLQQSAMPQPSLMQCWPS